jgi:cystathionine beta-lyase
MDYNFDRTIDRRGTDSSKWCHFGDDVLPLWVADMDFLSPEPVIRALHQRVEHGIFGYGIEPPEFRAVLVERLQRLYGWQVAPEALVFLPGVVTAFNLASRTVTRVGDGLLVQTPIYYPILRVPRFAHLVMNAMELTCQPDGQYEIDFDLMEATITACTRLFILCNPHNPVGRVFRRDELERMAEICLSHNIIICSDEIHCDLVFEGHQHLPIASLSPEIADRTITLMAPSKTYNIAGLHCSVAIVPNAELRDRFCGGRADLVPAVDVLGFTAGLAAYRDGQPWLDAVLRYLQANREFVLDYVADQLPGIAMARPEGTYLAWLDCRGSGIPGNPHQFFLEQAKVAVNDGAAFGKGGQGFVRLNFGCPRSTLTEALERMRKALDTLT